MTMNKDKICVELGAIDKAENFYLDLLWCSRILVYYFLVLLLIYCSEVIVFQGTCDNLFPNDQKSKEYLKCMYNKISLQLFILILLVSRLYARMMFRCIVK